MSVSLMLLLHKWIVVSNRIELILSIRSESNQVLLLFELTLKRGRYAAQLASLYP